MLGHVWGLFPAEEEETEDRLEDLGSCWKVLEPVGVCGQASLGDPGPGRREVRDLSKKGGGEREEEMVHLVRLSRSQDQSEAGQRTHHKSKAI